MENRIFFIGNGCYKKSQSQAVSRREDKEMNMTDNEKEMEETCKNKSVDDLTNNVNPKSPTPLPPIPSDIDDYWAYKVFEAAKKKVLAYFATLSVLVSVAVTLFGIDRIRTLVDKQYVAKLEEKEKEATDRVEALTKAFEVKLNSVQFQVEKRSQEFHRIVGVTLNQVTSAPGSISVKKIDLSSAIGPIRNQGEEGSTTGFSAAYALEAEYTKVHGATNVFSARSIYVEARRNDEWTGEDYEGSSVQGAMRGLKEVGAYLDGDWPHESELEPLPNKKPAVKISSYKSIPKERTDLFIEALSNDKAVVVSLQITDDFSDVREDGKLTISSDPRIVGGHTVCIVGYNRETNEFKFANSWGTSWGSSGFGYIHQSDLRDIVTDAYTLSL